MIKKNILSSYWLADVQSQNIQCSLDVPSSSKVIVIGGGLMGVSVTYWLSKLGIDTILLESNRLSSGSSGRNAGLMLFGGAKVENPALVENVLREEDIDADFIESGHLALANSEMIWDKICKEAERRIDSKIKIYALSFTECEEMLNMRLSNKFYGGRWMPSGKKIHPAKLVYGLAKASLRYGAKVFTETKVLKVTSFLNGYKVITTRGEIIADTVVYACSAWICDFFPRLKKIITPIRGQVLSTDSLPPMFSYGMAVDWGTVYWNQTSEGNIIIGGLSHLDESAKTNNQNEINMTVHNALERFLPSSFPGFPEFAVVFRWSGIMDCPQDGKPIVGKIAENENQWIVGGFNGHGMPVGLGVGDAVAESIESGYPSELLEPYSPLRFDRILI